MDSYTAKDTAFDERCILGPMRQPLTGDDGKMYGQPFYGESSFLMYRNVFAEKGLTIPAHPTWQQITDLAAKADGADEGHALDPPARLGHQGPSGTNCSSQGC